MATVRLRTLKGLDPEVRRRIRKALSVAKDDNRDPNAIPPASQEEESKWHNVRTTVDGINFASKREANRYSELKLELLAGEISELELQKSYSLDVNGIHICNYVADFVYRRRGDLVVEDVKSNATLTSLYKVKKKLMRAVRGVQIREVF